MRQQDACVRALEAAPGVRVEVQPLHPIPQAALQVRTRHCQLVHGPQAQGCTVQHVLQPHGHRKGLGIGDAQVQTLKGTAFVGWFTSALATSCFCVPAVPLKGLMSGGVCTASVKH